jgi:alpha-glucuronidase
MKYFWLAARLVALVLPSAAMAETGYDAWLRYAPIPASVRERYSTLPAHAVGLSDSVMVKTAQAELIRGVRGTLGRTLRADADFPKESAIVLGTFAAVKAAAPSITFPAALPRDGYWLKSIVLKGFPCLLVTAPNDRGVLYGVFALLSKIAQNQSVTAISEVQQPYAPVRWVNQWENLDGRTERGFAGGSIFFENGSVRADLARARDYARLLASVGINGCNINNVNADPQILTDNFLPQLARVAEVFRPWGVALSIAVDLSSPKVVGGLDTFDPQDPRVAAWWRNKIDQIYQQVPDFGGVVVKADSEGRLGPSTYGRTPADAANVIARALAPHGGVVFYRAFVYNHHLDWREPKNDRARAAYDIFHPLDGKFEDNVVIQIKNGPIDFQVREPASPLFAGLRNTNQAIELQIIQEYLGQQRHLCFLPPMWKEVLDFDMRADGRSTPVKDLVAGRTFHRPLGGFVGVSNVGMDTNWLGHPLAMANLFGFGRLAWNPNLSAGAIAEEWTRLTFGNDPFVVRTVSAMQLTSWHIYEDYTGPLGIGTLTNIVGSHYGPGIESAERNGWGQWFRGDHDGIGMERSVATGTGYVGQYPSDVAKLYESVKTTPDELLLFFHHVPYTYVLHSGKTMIQYVYDSHYEGVEQANGLVRQWKSLHGRVDDERYADILARLEYQAGHAIVWRDAVCTWFLRMSGIPDAKGRVGNYPDRIEAEGMELQGYAPFDMTPPENASGGKGVACAASHEHCTATFHFDRAAGWYEVDVRYFDLMNGESKFKVWVGDQQVDEWVANAHLPTLKPDGDNSMLRRIPGLALRPGDAIRIEGYPDGGERAPLDYVEIHHASE